MQRKKIFDIIPPKKAKVEKPPERFRERLVAPTPLPKRPLSFKRVLILGLGFLGICSILCYIFIKSKAEIEIWPKTKVLDFKTQVTVASFIEKPDFLQALIAGEFIEAEKTLSQEFPSTGKILKEEKAKGKIRVYNAYSTYSQPLVATTRFVSDDGKLFRTPKQVVIPGAHYEKGKLVPGFIDIEVIADQPGKDYNIGPSTFSIPGFAGTAKYTAFYGKSFEPMTGGMISEISQVTQKDLDAAQKVLKERALEESKIAMEREVLPELVRIEGAQIQEVIEVSPFAQAGQTLESFLVQVKAKTKTLAFKKSDLDDFAKNYILGKISPNEAIKPQTINIKYFPETVNLEQGKITLNLEMSAKIYSAINLDSLKEMIQGKKPDQIKEIFEALPEILRTRVKLSPFWANTLPQDLNRIKVKLNLD